MAVKSVCDYLRRTEVQMRFLEYLIWQSKDASEITRKLLIWLLRQTDQLTTQVFINCPSEICADVSHGLHDMCSYLDAVFKATGSAMSPVLYNGTYGDDGNPINKNGFAIFIHDRGSRTAKLVECNMRAVNSVAKPNPYGV